MVPTSLPQLQHLPLPSLGSYCVWSACLSWVPGMAPIDSWGARVNTEGPLLTEHPGVHGEIDVVLPSPYLAPVCLPGLFLCLESPFMCLGFSSSGSYSVCQVLAQASFPQSLAPSCALPCCTCMRSSPVCCCKALWYSLRGWCFTGLLPNAVS